MTLTPALQIDAAKYKLSCYGATSPDGSNTGKATFKLLRDSTSI
jgi:hypothetical protein